MKETEFWVRWEEPELGRVGSPWMPLQIPERGAEELVGAGEIAGWETEPGWSSKNLFGGGGERRSLKGKVEDTHKAPDDVCSK